MTSQNKHRNKPRARKAVKATKPTRRASAKANNLQTQRVVAKAENPRAQRTSVNRGNSSASNISAKAKDSQPLTPTRANGSQVKRVPVKSRGPRTRRSSVNAKGPRSSVRVMIVFAVLTVFVVLSGISMYTFFPVQMPLIGNQVSTGDHVARDNELASEMANKKRGDTLGDQSISEATTDVIQNTDYSGWTVGLASAYGSDSIGVATASGTPLDNYSYTIAVPAEKSYLLGASVEIGYGGTSVTALINDTGGFGAMGRDFDLGPAIWHTFGASTESDWGLRTIYYRFVQ